jgi:hypothetical protein
MMLLCLRPIEFNIHVVLTGLEVRILLPCVSHPSHFAILINQNFLFIIRVFNFTYDEADVGVFVIDFATEASLVSLYHR